MDARMLTYITPPLDADMHMAGSPTIDLMVSSTHTDGVVIVYLEDVDEKGRSRYVTEGGMRLIHRKLSQDSLLGISPYASFARRDAAPMRPGGTGAGAFSHPADVGGRESWASATPRHRRCGQRGARPRPGTGDAYSNDSPECPCARSARTAGRPGAHTVAST